MASISEKIREVARHESTSEAKQALQDLAASYDQGLKKDESIDPSEHAVIAEKLAQAAKVAHRGESQQLLKALPKKADTAYGISVRNGSIKTWDAYLSYVPTSVFNQLMGPRWEIVSPITKDRLMTTTLVHDKETGNTVRFSTILGEFKKQLHTLPTNIGVEDGDTLATYKAAAPPPELIPRIFSVDHTNGQRLDLPGIKLADMLRTALQLAPSATNKEIKEAMLQKSGHQSLSLSGYDNYAIPFAGELLDYALLHGVLVVNQKTDAKGNLHEVNPDVVVPDGRHVYTGPFTLFFDQHQKGPPVYPPAGVDVCGVVKIQLDRPKL